MLTPKEVSEKVFDRTFGIGYRIDDVEAYLQHVASSMTELLEINADLEKKLEVLADKLNEYREDEESLRTAILGAQKLGDSVIRESKTKAEIITRDATCKAEAMVNNAKRQIEREQENLIRTQREVASFKGRLLDMYKRHIELISAIPGEIEAEEKEEEAAVQQAAPVEQPEENTAFMAGHEDVAPVIEQDEQPKQADLEEQFEASEISRESFFGLDLDEAPTEQEGAEDGAEDDDDDDNDEDSEKESAPSRFSDMRFGEAFKIKHNSNHPKYRK